MCVNVCVCNQLKYHEKFPGFHATQYKYVGHKIMINDAIDSILGVKDLANIVIHYLKDGKKWLIQERESYWQFKNRNCYTVTEMSLREIASFPALDKLCRKCNEVKWAITYRNTLEIRSTPSLVKFFNQLDDVQLREILNSYYFGRNPYYGTSRYFRLGLSKDTMIRFIKKEGKDKEFPVSVVRHGFLFWLLNNEESLYITFSPT